MKPSDALLQDQVDYLASQSRTALSADIVILLAKSDDEHSNETFGIAGISSGEGELDEVLASAIILLSRSLQQLIKKATHVDTTVILRTPRGDISLPNARTLSFRVEGGS